MIYRKYCAEGTPLSSVSYCFLKPARLQIFDGISGKEELIGYGIGEKIQVLELEVQYLIALHEKLDKIPMSDGRFIVEWPEDLEVKRENYW